jgi:C-terminal processing protease CtpA/Prc
MFSKPKNKKVVGVVVLVVLAVAVGFYFQKKPVAHYKTPEEANVYVRFDMEAYDLILQNYWKTTNETDLSQLFQLSLQKVENSAVAPTLATTTRAGAAKMLFGAFQNATSTEERKQLAENVLIVALYNLFPAGRSGLLSQAQQTALRQDVANVNPSNDLYQNLGLADGASAEDVQSAYQKQKTELEASTTPAAKAQLSQITYADKVLTNQNSKSLYDQQKIEPTVFSHIIGKTLYLFFDKISPTTLQEFGATVDSASTTPLDSMIIDLRGNIGGSLDFAQYFLGLFIGPNQYAFDLYHQGDYNVQRTTSGKFDELSRYKEMAILTNNMTQSTAELLTASMKRFHLAVVVGGKTRGWGTVENTFPITTVIDPKETYSLLLVHSLTLRDDNQPIEQNGVLPDVDVNQSGWQKQVSSFFKSSGMTDAVISAVSQPPVK